MLRTFFKNLLLVAVLANFSACSPFISGKITDTSAGVVGHGLSGGMSKLTWSYNRGFTSPDYQYGVIYAVDFTTDTFSISVDKGPLVTDLLPLPRTRPLSESEMNSIRSYVAKLSYLLCDDDLVIMDLPTDVIRITNLGSEIPFYGSDCSGFGNAYRQADSGSYADLVNLLLSL